MTTTAKQKHIALDRIAAEIASCRTCKQKKVGIAVPGEGSPDAQVMFIGEAPGKEEAKTGRPFIGRSGKLLRQYIRESGLREEDVYITSPVKYLPKHVTPTREEIAHGATHLRDQLNVIQPTIVVLLGRTACRAFLSDGADFSKIRGAFLEHDGRVVLVTYHPAAILYSRKLEQAFRADFFRLQNAINAKATK